jgi:hypothetical protein
MHTIKRMTRLRILLLIQYITLIFIGVLIVFYYDDGDKATVYGLIIFAFLLFGPNFVARIRKGLSYKEFRTSIGLMIALVWHFSLVEILFTIETHYGTDLGLYLYLITSTPFVIFFLCIFGSGEWRDLQIKQIALKESQKSDVEHVTQLASVFIYAKEVSPDPPVWGLPLRVIACLNTSLRENIRQRRYQEIIEALEKVKEGIRIKDGLKKYIKGGRNPQVNYDAVRKSEQCDGLYIILTTTAYPTEKVVQQYFDRDLVEKSFCSLKSTLSIQPVRHWLTGRIRAHIFICYLAYFHLTWMKMLLRTHNITMSPVKALESLETIYMVKLTDEKASASVTKTVPLTKEQEALYKALNLLS